MEAHKQFPVVRYVITYVLLVTISLPLMLVSWGVYVLRVIVIPGLVLVTILLVSDLFRGRNVHIHNVLRVAAAPALFSYLSLGSLSSILMMNYKAYSVAINYLVNFLIFIIIGISVVGLSSRYYALSNYELSQSLRYSAYFLIFLGLGYLISIAYQPLFYPFLAMSIIYLVLTPIPILSRSKLNFVLINTRALAIAAFGVGLFYTILSIPKPSQWNTYILIVFLILASIIITYAGYKALISSFNAVEKVEEEVYEAHKHELGIVSSPEYALFEEAVKEFVTHGKKDKLITYLTYWLSRDGLDYEEILSRLNKLINYSSAIKCRGRVNRRLVELEVRDRVELVNELLTQVLSGDREEAKGG